MRAFRGRWDLAEIWRGRRLGLSARFSGPQGLSQNFAFLCVVKYSFEYQMSRLERLCVYLFGVLPCHRRLVRCDPLQVSSLSSFRVSFSNVMTGRFCSLLKFSCFKGSVLFIGSLASVDFKGVFCLPIRFL